MNWQRKAEWLVLTVVSWYSGHERPAAGFVVVAYMFQRILFCFK